MPKPAWLDTDGAKSEIVLSTRCRHARNLFGFRFPSSADSHELKRAAEVIHVAAPSSFHRIERMSEVERDYWVGARLISPDFPYRDLHRAVYIEDSRKLALMVHEEDHLRLQSVTAGWSIEEAYRLSSEILAKFENGLKFAYWQPIGYLTASPFNSGPAQRVSAMMHLVALAHGKRLPNILNGLSANKVIFRGLFGETSRAVGAFFQISTLDANLENFCAACEYLIDEETNQRAKQSREELQRRAEEVRKHVVESRTLDLASALRSLSWLRWASIDSPSSWPFTFRELDSWLAGLDVHGTSESRIAAQHRAQYLREKIEGRPALAGRPEFR